MPTGNEVAAVEDGVFALAGFSGVVEAIDRTLIRIPRPSDFEGWYGRKGFPAVNAQAVVDHRGVFRSLSVRAGSTNDQSLWHGSDVKKKISSYVPQGKLLLSDAGYKVWQHLIAPYPEAAAATSKRMRRYNYRHSRARIAVECAFGRMKNRFRILLGKIEQKTKDYIVKIYTS
ncbi:hypothetical protein PF005_g27146 [Phytophthora fragariae]|uniref:DDE Tnp4 domain-containing protein n=1 Tax=Phytophthora fragariae TaxID=53985 RepID=A0A6A4BR35_9STRA|nr:hypothetical protein PF009_g5976 [Phytophthora fragariae]KAE9069796.1 hypothetical protein PF007_g27175 [Phytophthora fragariae]KAE9083473.1 hypothetical protein PF006_g26680 [Phytophthora fragariae]KAE9171418.1 hypothetical protein PF005_g27146 [Phytophthora fragariae]KAE9279020.1 hypothetical protein PF001_g24902 [Phytophthora fragariae]